MDIGNILLPPYGKAISTVKLYAFRYAMYESCRRNKCQINLKTAVDFNAEAQRCRVTQRKSEVLWGNGKCENFSDGVNLHQLGVACMVLQK